MKVGKDVDWTKLPTPIHTVGETDPYITAITALKDPETGFYNTCHAGTTPTHPNRGLMSFVTPHSFAVMKKWRERGVTEILTRSWRTSRACTWICGASSRWSAR